MVIELRLEELKRLIPVIEIAGEAYKIKDITSDNVAWPDEGGDDVIIMTLESADKVEFDPFADLALDSDMGFPGE